MDFFSPQVNNLTLNNFILRVFGPLHERTLVITLLAIQVGVLLFFLCALCCVAEREKPVSIFSDALSHNISD